MTVLYAPLFALFAGLNFACLTFVHIWVESSFCLDQILQECEAALASHGHSLILHSTGLNFACLSYVHICFGKSCLSLFSDEFLRPMDLACGVLRSTTPSSGSKSIAFRISKCDFLFRKVNQIMMASCCAPCVETCGNK